MKKLSLAQFSAGIAMLAIGFLVNLAMNALWPALAAEYAESGLFRPWSDRIMWFYYLYPFVVAVMLARVWHWALPLNPNWTKFAWLGFLTLTIPGMLITYASFQISFWMVLGWTIIGLLQLFAAGYLFAKIIK